MPGLDACGRCGSNLNLATAVLDVNPPRATPWQKRLRRLLPRSSLYRLRDAARDGRNSASILLDEAGVPLPGWSVLGRLVIPGWAHFFLGQSLRGRFFLGAYLAMLGGGMLFWGTGPGNFFLGLAVSVHASAAVDVLYHSRARIASRVGACVVVLLVLSLVIYMPLVRLVNQVAMPMTVQFDSPLFKEGDVLLVNQGSAPRTGNVVLYALPRGAQLIPMQFAAGQSVDRILAGPRDHVVWEKEQLIVNGQVSPLRPLNPSRMPERMEIAEVPADHYFIFPTAVQLGGHNLPPDGLAHALRTMSLVPAGQIQGTVYFRTQPLTRLGLIH